MTVPSLPVEPAADPIEIGLIVACVAVIGLGLFGFLASNKGLKKGDNPSLQKILEFFREAGAVSPEKAVAKKDLPFWMTSPTTESNVFQAMGWKKLIKKAGKAYWLDEEALARFISE